MKKFMFAMLFVAGASITAFAQEVPALNLTDVLKTIPTLKQGIAYSVLDSRINYLTTVDLFNYKGINLEAGYAGISKSTGDKVVAVVSYDLWDAKKAGVTIPVLDLVKFRPGIYAGAGRLDILNKSAAKGNNEFDLGLSLTLIDVKF